jgi:hypothetical protein
MIISFCLEKALSGMKQPRDKTNFIFFYGILKVGMPFTVVVTLLDYTWDYGFAYLTLNII